MKASDLFVKALENEQVEYIFAVPGEENLDLLDSIRKSKKIKLIITRHEQGAGFMAATYGRLTGKPGVAMSTLGPGATNFVTSAAYAQLGGMPFLMITGQKPIRKSKQGSFQIIDTVDMFQEMTKYNKQLVSAESISSVIRNAFKYAIEEKPGAVHINLPEDIAREIISDDFVLPIPNQRRPVAEDKAIDLAVNMIEDAKYPILVIGSAANRKRTSKMLTEFIKKTNIPFINTQMGKGVVDERNDNFLGTAALSSGDFVHCAIEKSDLIINVGHDVVEKPPFIMNENKAKVIHINFYSADVSSVYFPQHEVIGAIANAIWQFKQKIKVKKNRDFACFSKVKKKVEEDINNKIDSSKFPLIPQKIVSTIRKVMDENDILTLDNGMYKLWFARNFKAYSPNTIILDNALATMGAGLPSAITASLVYPEKKIVAVVGDGGFMMNSQELETAMRLNLNLLVIILNDSGYGMIKWKQKNHGLKEFGLDFSNPDFVKYAQSYGARGIRITKDSNFEKILSDLMNKKGIDIVDVPIDYSENDSVFSNSSKNIGGKKC